MRNTLVAFFALGSLACSSEMPTQNDSHLRTAPPTLSISATSREVLNANGSLDLEVSALLRNSTKSHIALVNGAQCPLFVRIFLDPTGEFSNSLDPSMGCPIGGPTVDLSPSDTALLTRVVPANTLASFAPGTYGINVVVTTTTVVSGVWAGAIVLPLGTPR